MHKSINNIKTQDYISPNWSIKLSESWESEYNDNIYYFFNPQGYGALIITEYTQNISIAIKDILELVEFEESELERLQEVKCGDFSGLYVEYIDEEKNFWRKWWVINNKLLLFITYNCNCEDKDKEKIYVDKILTSLKV